MSDTGEVSGGTRFADGAWRSPALRVLMAIAVVHALYVGRSFVVPIVIALLLSFLLAPSVRLLTRLRLPGPVAAALVLGLGLLAAGSAAYRLAAPASEWIDQVPRAMDRAEALFTELAGPVARVREATERVEDMASLGEEREEPQQVEVAGTGLSDTLFELTIGFLAQLLFVVVFLYALLASGNLVVDKLFELTPGISRREHMMLIARRTERQVSRYLLTVTMINICLGLATAGAMYLLGMPNPLLWGFIGGLFNFVPILGSMITSSVLLLVAATQFDQVGRIILPALAFLALTGVEAYLVTPSILAQRLTLNLVVVFLSLFFWGWLWGPVGALLAVPMLATTKIVADQIDALAPVARLLGD